MDVLVHCVLGGMCGCSLEPGPECLSFTTVGGGIATDDACPSSGDALKPSFLVGKRGCKKDIKGLVEESLVMGGKTMWAM